MHFSCWDNLLWLDNQVFMPLEYFHLLKVLGLLFSVSTCILRENIEYLDF